MNAQPGETLLQISPDEFARTVDDLERDSFRLLMIKPADSPREALLQKSGESVRLVQSPMSKVQSQKDADLSPWTVDIGPASGSEWKVGRAGMMYRDLVPDRLGGRLIASHIRITEGGPVADKVHYHKIDFQVIYCLKGAIRVVYESQGEQFWLRPGDCVLQPPEIRHRVLEAEAGSEVIEITSPAEHETWFDHETQLPTADMQPERVFGRQLFFRHTAVESDWKPTDFDEIMCAETRIPGVRVLRSEGISKDLVKVTQQQPPELLILIDGSGIHANLDKY